MLLKFLLKIWPSLIPIAVYIFWVYVVDRFFPRNVSQKNKEGIIEGEKIVGEKSTENAPQKFKKFSLQDPCFVIILYMSLILAILTLIVTAFH